MKKLTSLLVMGTAAGFLLCAQAIYAQATITTSFPNVGASEDALTQGTQLTMRVAVTANSSGHAPSASSVRVYFNATAVSWNSVVAQDLGDVQTSQADETDPAPPTGYPATFRDVATLGPPTFPPTNQTPVCFDVVFDVLAGAATEAPYQILVDADPGPDETKGTSDDACCLPWVVVSPPGVGEVGSVTFDNTVSAVTDVVDWSLY